MTPAVFADPYTPQEHLTHNGSGVMPLMLYVDSFSSWPTIPTDEVSSEFIGD